MGALLSRIRKEQTTELKLEQLEEKIKKIEEYGVNTQERKKRFVGTFLAVAVGIYVIAVISIVYYVYFPVTWKERVLYIVPLLIFPYVIVLLRRLFTWHFQRKLNKNSEMLKKLRAEKKEILEQVMDKETYKVAVNLLTRFGDRSTNNRLSLGGNPRPTAMTPLNTQPTLRPLAKPTGSQFAGFSPLTANPPNRIATTSQMPLNQSLAPPTSQSLSRTTPKTPSTDQQLRRRTPFPIVNQADKSIFERCLDLLIGDGPQDRFAVICSECHSHNGMALKEEFDYIAYRCAFCNAMNPARKTRPKAPRLTLLAPTDAGSPHSISRSGDSSNSTATPQTSDEEHDLEHTSRRIQLRLTESTVNHSDSPEFGQHDTIVSTAAAVATESNDVSVPKPTVEDVPEPMDIAQEEEDEVEEETKKVKEEESEKEEWQKVVNEAEKKMN